MIIKKLGSEKNDQDSKNKPVAYENFLLSLDNLIEGCQILDFNWNIIYLNKSAEKHNRRSNSELLGKYYFEIWPGIESSEVYKKIKLCMDERTPFIMENEFHYPDGNTAWFDLSIQPIQEGVFILSLDISEKKQIEKINLVNEEKFRHVFEAANVGKSITKLNGEIEVNQAFYDMLGYTKEEIANKHWKDITPPDEIEETEEIVNSMLRGEKDAVRFNKGYIHKNGSIVFTDVSSTLYRSRDGSPQYFITTVIDITPQRKTEKALSKSEHQLQLFVKHSPAAIAMFDSNMRYVIASNRYLTDYNIPDQNIIGKSHYEVFPEISDHWKEIHQRCLKGETIVAEEDIFPRSNGKIDWLRWEIHPWYESDGVIGGIILFSEVITDRILDQQALRKSEDLFNKAFHGSPSPMIIVRQIDGVYIAVNQSFLNLFEITREEAIGKRGNDLNLIDAEQRSEINRQLKDQETITNMEITAQSRSGRNLYLLLSIENVELSKEPCIIITLQDITERKLSELKLKEKTEEIEAQNEEYHQLNEELIQINDELEEAKVRAEDSDRLKTAFLHNISHEIRTPMNAIMGFTSLLKNSVPELDKQLRYFDIIEQSSNQLLAIITDIIDIASIEAGQVKVNETSVNINKVLWSLYEQHKPQAEKKGLILNLTTPLPDEKAETTTDERKLIQIASNILGNAIKFTNEGHINFGYILKNDTVEFYVEDTGIGIPAKFQEKIFDRFHQVETTKITQSGGSGLGLSISKGYLELLRGKIWTASEPGKGSTFYFTLPYTKK